MKTEELTKRIAIFQSPYGGFIVCEHADTDKDSTEYVRVSEPITVTFTARKQAEVMAAAVKAIDAQIVDAQMDVEWFVNSITGDCDLASNDSRVWARQIGTL